MVVVSHSQMVTSSLPSKSKPGRERFHQENSSAKEFNPDMKDLRVQTSKPLASDTKSMKDSIKLSNLGTSSVCPPCTLAFVYGTLKRGFGNHWLIEEVMAKGHAKFLGIARTKQRFPMVCGPYQVPFLLDIPAAGHHVRGELYEVWIISLLFSIFIKVSALSTINVLYCFTISVRSECLSSASNSSNLHETAILCGKVSFDITQIRNNYMFECLDLCGQGFGNLTHEPIYPSVKYIKKEWLKIGGYFWGLAMTF